MKLASYHGTRSGIMGLGNIAIRLRLRGRFSHSEIVFEPGDGVDRLMPDGTCEPDADGAGGVLSGSYPNPGFAVDMATQGELGTQIQLVYNALADIEMPPGTVVGQVLKWDGSSWVPGTDETGGGGGGGTTYEFALAGLGGF